MADYFIFLYHFIIKKELLIFGNNCYWGNIQKEEITWLKPCLYRHFQ